MAVDKLVDSTQLDADLTSVANAIRTKGGTSSDLSWPNGFVSAVQAIPTGQTPTGTKQISITQNGVTTEDVTNYANAEITANVPNTYSAGDEGKVVSSGALVAQGSDTVTQNDTYDTTLISSLTVNVSGGGVTLAPMDYSVTLKNNRSSTISCNKLFYSATVTMYALAANISANSSATYNNMLTDGTHIWFGCTTNISNIKYNGENATYAVSSSKYIMLTIPTGFDGTIPFDLYF